MICSKCFSDNTTTATLEDERKICYCLDCNRGSPLNAILKYRTDIMDAQGNKGNKTPPMFEGNIIHTSWKSDDIKQSFSEFFEKCRESRPEIIIKTYPHPTLKNNRGKWYKKTTMIKNNPLLNEEYQTIKFEFLRNVCDSNSREGKWKTRDCYLINWNLIE